MKIVSGRFGAKRQYFLRSEFARIPMILASISLVLG